MGAYRFYYHVVAGGIIYVDHRAYKRAAAHLYFWCNIKDMDALFFLRNRMQAKSFRKKKF